MEFACSFVGDNEFVFSDSILGGSDESWEAEGFCEGFSMASKDGETVIVIVGAVVIVCDGAVVAIPIGFKSVGVSVGLLLSRLLTMEGALDGVVGWAIEEVVEGVHVGACIDRGVGNLVEPAVGLSEVIVVDGDGDFFEGKGDGGLDEGL